MTLRERMNAHPWITTLVALLALLLLADLVLWRVAVRSRRLAARQRARLSEMEKLAAECRSLRRRIASATPASSVGRKDLSVGLVDGIAQRMRVLRGSMSENRQELRDGLRERIVTLRLRKITRQKLASFLLAVEKAGRDVYTRELTITPSAQSPGLVDASVQFAAMEPSEETDRAPKGT